MIEGGKLSALIGTILFTFGLITIEAEAQDYSAVESNGPLLLREYGSFSRHLPYSANASYQRQYVLRDH